MTPQWLKDFVARLTRKRILRGRAGQGVYSLESWRSAPSEPQRSDNARRAGHYGFVSEAPSDGTVEVVTVALNGGATNPAAVAETVVGEPTIEDREVLLWSLFGQRLHLDNNQRVAINNGDGGTLFIDGDETTISQDLTVARDTAIGRDATIARDLTADHLLGSGDVEHGCIANAPKIATATANGDDLSFELTFAVANSQTLSAGDLIATIALARSYPSAPRVVASPTADSWPVAGVSFGARATGGGIVTIRYLGANPISGPAPDLSVTVFVVGKT